jgi:hypothetical protein
MATMSIRGLDEKALAELKRQAKREGASLNSLVVRLLQGAPGMEPGPRTPRTFDDLDALAGTWSSRQARDFERHTAPFREVDPALWK